MVKGDTGQQGTPRGLTQHLALHWKALSCSSHVEERSLLKSFYSSVRVAVARSFCSGFSAAAVVHGGACVMVVVVGRRRDRSGVGGRGHLVSTFPWLLFSQGSMCLLLGLSYSYSAHSSMVNGKAHVREWKLAHQSRLSL